ncbi:MAG: hypothetical protein GX625_02950 [Clostridiaceae bacterium]|nr:hypothetical protein [Clostridiaceae bacterium]
MELIGTFVDNSHEAEKMRKKRLGQCKICLQTDIKMSEDHIPPRSVQPFLNIVAFNPLNMRTDDYVPNTYYSQNGLKFPTICSSCNSKLQKYDASLRHLVHDLRKFANSKLYLPGEIRLAARPNAIMRGILGHLLASKTYVDDCVEDGKFRDCVLDANIPIPDGVFFSYWIYRHHSMKVFRDYIMPRKRGVFAGNPGVFHAIKFQPIAFLVTDFPEYEGLYTLNKFKSVPLTQEEEILFRLDRNYSEHWPEIVDDKNFIMMGKSLEDTRSAIKKE